MAAGTRIGAMLGIKEYPTPSVAGMFDRLLCAPFASRAHPILYIYFQGAGQGLLQRQINRMANVGDFARLAGRRAA